jgi:hypothetical protein
MLRSWGDGLMARWVGLFGLAGEMEAGPEKWESPLADDPRRGKAIGPHLAA